jgi:hypothetical protein
VLKVGWIQKESFIVFGVQTKLEPLPIGASVAPKIVKNEIKWRKLQPSKVEGSRTQKNQTIEHYNGWFLIIQKLPCMLLFCC